MAVGGGRRWSHRPAIRWGTSCEEQPRKVPTNVIGPLLREGTLAIGCSCRTLEVRSLNGDYGIGGGVVGDVVDDGCDGVVGNGVGGVGRMHGYCDMIVL